MAESAQSSFSAWVCARMCLYVWNKYARVHAMHAYEMVRKSKGDINKWRHLRKSPEGVTRNMFVCVCVPFTVRQCVKMSRFDCRRFMSHNWWLTVHLPCTHTQTHKHTHMLTHILFPVLPWSTDHEEYVQAALLMHIYTEAYNTHTSSAGELQRLLCESVCLFVCPFT